jgi:hypothetical protein
LNWCKILENISKIQPDNAPLLLNSINLPNITHEECIKIISSLNSSPICVLLGTSSQNENSLERDWQYEYDQLKIEYDRIKNDNSKKVIQKPSDFEPDIFQACEEGKLSSVQYLIQNGTNIEITDPEIHSNYLLIIIKILH